MKRIGFQRIFFILSLVQLISCQEIGDVTISLELQKEDSSSKDKRLRLAIIGDSISTFYGYLASDIKDYDGKKYVSYYPKGDVNKVGKTWWYIVAEALSINLDDVCNCSWSGSRVTGNSSSVTSAESACSTRRIQDLSAKGFDPDIIICYISCNDWAGNVSMGSWSDSDPIPVDGIISTMREAYALMLYKIKSFYPNATIFCLTNLEDVKRDKTVGWPSNNDNDVTVEEWNKSIVEIATFFNCQIINLQDCGINYDNASQFTLDGGLHPNHSGMKLIAGLVVDSIKTVIE